MEDAKKAKVRHAWYSARQDALRGSSLYARADGSTVVVTAVSVTMDHGCGWDDMAYVGEVTDWLGRIGYGEMGAPRAGIVVNNPTREA